MDDSKFVSLDDLRQSIDMHLDIEFYLGDNRYNISWLGNKPFVALCPDGWCIDCTTTDEVLDCIVDGMPLRDQWYKIKIIAM